MRRSVCAVRSSDFEQVDGRSRRVLGSDEGVYEVPDDFDAPLPDDVLADFER